MDTEIAIRDFLISRRTKLRPEDLGLPRQGMRRVRGLRREEVAALANVSVDQYIRLERGQASRVSDAVVDAVAHALRLTPGECRYLRSLARPAAASPEAGAGRPVRESVQRFLDSMCDTPAYLVGRGGAILAWNRMAVLVFVDFARVPTARRTVGLLVFTDPRARLLYVDWEVKAREAVAYLRTESGKRPHDAALSRQIEELAEASADFRRLWAAQLVLDHTHDITHLNRPPVGTLDLTWEAFQPKGDPDELVIVYTAANARTAAALGRLA
ncbi:helix-turn-helix domain-containing protein [Embleya sp. NPDC008237]|uniref:helix-turn-helix domain-containing protein n=1 Tax=Embleya sp. NPDC008237 TaxID=3363978 RepID=UPI0036EAFAB5